MLRGVGDTVFRYQLRRDGEPLPLIKDRPFFRWFTWVFRFKSSASPPPPPPQQTVQLGWSRNSVFAILRNTKLDKVVFLFLETSRNLVKYLVKVCRFRSAKFFSRNKWKFRDFLSGTNAIMCHLFLDSCLRKIGNDLLYTYSVQLYMYLKETVFLV